MPIELCGVWNAFGMTSLNVGSGVGICAALLERFYSWYLLLQQVFVIRMPNQGY